MGIFKKEEKKFPIQHREDFGLKLPEFPSQTLPKFQEPSIPTQIRYQEREPIRQVPQSRPVVTTEKPLFLKLDKYERVIRYLNQVKSTLDEARAILNNLKEIKDEEDQRLQEWHDSLEEIKEKIISIDQILAQSVK